MTTESVAMKDGTSQSFLHLNLRPNNQLRTEKLGVYYGLFVAMLHSLYSITNKQQCKKLLYKKGCFGKCGEKSIT